MVRVKIDGNTMHAAAGAASRGEDVEYRDTETPGLSLRVHRGRCYWYWTRRDGKTKISEMKAFKAKEVDFLRKLVPKMRAMLADGKNPKLIVDEVLAGDRDIESAENKAGVKEGEWAWEDLRDKYLEHVQKTLKAKTFQGHRNALAHMSASKLEPAFKAIAGKPIKSITAKQLMAVVQSILDRGHYDQARLTHAALRGAFKWGFTQEEAQLEVNVAVMAPAPKRPSVRKDQVSAKVAVARRIASPGEIGKFAFWWLWDSYEGHKRTKRAMQLQVLTGQRSASVIQAHRSEFHRTQGRPWKYVWALGPDKTGSYRLLPLPDVASFVVHHALEIPREGQEDNVYLFPQVKRAKGKQSLDGHLSYEATRNSWDECRKSKDGPLPSDFDGGHDFRRAFITHLSDWKSLGFESKQSVEMVTHFNEGRTTVAQKIYDFDEHLAEKFKVLQAYERMLLWSGQGRAFDEEEHERNWEIEE